VKAVVGIPFIHNIYANFGQQVTKVNGEKCREKGTRNREAKRIVIFIYVVQNGSNNHRDRAGNTKKLDDKRVAAVFAQQLHDYRT